jgi:signal transduction histidine kinase
MLAVVTDLTEILRQSDLLGDFVRQIRHDLRGPLTSLRGAVDLLLSERVGSLEERQKKLLDLMDREAQQMADMISAAPAESERDASDKT